MGTPIKSLAAVGLILASTSAHADFAVSSGQGQLGPAFAGAARRFMPSPGVLADEPHVDPGDRQPPLAPRSRPAPKPNPHIVQGFGDQVPLSFACRQIVPSGTKVSYRHGADPQMLITWHGGDTWLHVLGDAIKPLGLHLVETGSRLEIRS